MTTPKGYTAWLAKRPDMEFPGREEWSPFSLATLASVNRRVNWSMGYRPEPADVWGEGQDCEDYAIKKLDALLAAGVPRGALRLAACAPGGRGTGHAVLIVNEEWILTNGRDDVFNRHRSKLIILAWEDVGGQWSQPGVSLATVIDADGGLGNPDGAESIVNRQLDG
jgi:hypothetical protein